MSANWSSHASGASVFGGTRSSDSLPFSDWRYVVFASAALYSRFPALNILAGL
jgi:hypothetical protein